MNMGTCCGGSGSANFLVWRMRSLPPHSPLLRSGLPVPSCGSRLYPHSVSAMNFIQSCSMCRLRDPTRDDYPDWVSLKPVRRATKVSSSCADGPAEESGTLVISINEHRYQENFADYLANKI